MYTEICHFLLLHAIFFVCLLFFCFLCLSFKRTNLIFLLFNRKSLLTFPRPFSLVTRRFNEVYEKSRTEGAQHNAPPRNRVKTLELLSTRHEVEKLEKISSVASSGQNASVTRFFWRPTYKERKALIRFWTLNKWIEMCTILSILLSAFFFVLSICFFGTIGNSICSDFSIYNTTTNSSVDIPLFYKISATWSNHEGSLLLWCWLLSLNTFLFSVSIRPNALRIFIPLNLSTYRPNTRTPLFHKKFKPDLDRKSYIFQTIPMRSWLALFLSTSILDVSRKKLCYPEGKTIFLISVIVFFFTTFCVMTSNPFLRTSHHASITSLAELNPVLQDPILAIHPPCIYAGYVASAIAFSLCLYLKDRSK